MAKRALIVDDSKTAQVRLRKMLERFEVDVDISSSAEEALGYLSYRQPSVIFLDHHMEGMSGLSALKIIKSNPATALIPVVMYTSEQGDVYVGQARALGALDIISKEVIKHSSIEKVLSSLGIPALGTNKDTGDIPSHDAPGSVVKEAKAPIGKSKPSSISQWGDDAGNKPSSDYVATTDLNKVQVQVGKLFEIHIAKVRQEIEDNTKFLMRRLSKEIQDKSAPKLGAAVKSAPAEPDLPEQDLLAGEAVRAGATRTSLWPLILIIVLVGFACYQMLDARETQRQSLLQIEMLTDQLGEQGAVVDQVLETVVAQQRVPKSGADARVMLDALGWAVNVNPTVPFGEKALNDERIYMLGELLALLKAANFGGTVFIDVHLGDYCVIKAPTGEWVLPEDDAALDSCVFIAEQAEEVSLGEQVSVGFLNYLHSTPVLTDGGISVELASMGYDSPKFSYPSATNATTAGQWNLAASRNSRLAFSFSPE
ncbi:response regulator [Marinagarivorans cellulosilyticus]|uniref:Response regulatory domain-containing protein n=1 Tax=Marinagarivorans cellulosilyticus TaxID=2721545 RepID=A0AAN2BLA5_9GAMM|nr:response regulator [Marinagarivorans cellulosilyticus]BCD98899.1 hypothetical protein MARGE09_P3100 [Marinagarivorans cellulosilyticus]